MAEEKTSILPLVGAISGIGAAVFTVIAALGIDIPTLNRLASQVPKQEARIANIETRLNLIDTSMAGRANHPNQITELRERVRNVERMTQQNKAASRRNQESIEFLVPQYLSHSHPLPIRAEKLPHTAIPHPP